MRVVLDTNVWVAAVLWRGAAHRLLEQLEERRAVIAITPHLLRELSVVLHRPKFASRLIELRITPQEILAALAEHTMLFVDVAPPSVPIVRDDPDDDHVISCAQAAQAQVIVTGDRHVLRLRRHQDIRILTIAQTMHWLQRLAGQ